MSKDAIRLDISTTVKHYLAADNNAPQGFGIEKYTDLQAGDFAILSNEGGRHNGPPVKTDHFALVLCMRGHGVKTIGHHTFEVTPQSIHIVSPRDLHSFENASDDLLLYMILFRHEFVAHTFIKEQILDQLLELPPELPPIYHLDEREFTSIRDLFIKIEREYREAPAYFLQMVRLLVVELLYEINRAHERALQQPTKPAGRPLQLVAAFKKLVEAHFLTIRTVQQYADLLHVSAKHLSEQVKHATGENALTIIHQRIFREAEYLLHTSDFSIKEIADQLNFDTSSHFSRFFKHFAGVNPSEFMVKKDTGNRRISNK
ncbi:AraC-type DNA-binding protein [Chitinophaga rupis]|uniref:AraC-type DNA-binding protein n=1 Tax=Chitinophaga rupis TaxID=573321 RepID=A0A1H7Y4R9_9BACT|nr:helix-turn-helix transcriptional regulator [Chitinophaga rupis]SEM40328.1 AraC-type DNA-binding protein [Chitinophaga rupis]